MTAKEILERIISENGSCAWATPEICDVCPLGRTRAEDTDRITSCADTLSIDGLTYQEADVRYKLAAAYRLIDLTIDSIIKKDSDEFEQQ